MSSRKTVEVFAPAKVNLTLHVTGRRADGYHDLDSIVVFADVGDRISARSADATGLTVTGPRARGIPTGADNLVLRAAALFRPPVSADITLEKQLPAAAGLGGGSADAAACLVALARLAERPFPDPGAILSLGADVPVCLAGRPVRMRGVGDVLTPLPPLPPLWIVLVNPGVAVSTPAVFRALARPDNAPMPEEFPQDAGAPELLAWLTRQRNDLEAPAWSLAPVIGDVLAAVAATPGCALARMSGSGATCFGLYKTAEAAEVARATLAQGGSGWWCAAAPVLRPQSV